uniref:Uncharacterized protein n=1 Tax=Megaselia scalaris TaxID=36166 RepID=T1GQV6_MEGSC
MWWFVGFLVVSAIAIAGRKWGRWIYLKYGRHLPLPRNLLVAKRPATPPISSINNVENNLDETREMQHTIT